MKAEEARKIAKSKVPFLDDTLKSIKDFSERGLFRYQPTYYRDETIEALKELGYYVFHKSQKIADRTDHWIVISWEDESIVEKEKQIEENKVKQIKEYEERTNKEFKKNNGRFSKISGFFIL